MIEPRAPTSHEGRGRVGGADRVRGAPSVDSAESARTESGEAPGSPTRFPLPLAGRGRGGGRRVELRRPGMGEALLQMPGSPPPRFTPAPPTPLGLSGRVGPPRKGEGTRRRFEALLQSERTMLESAPLTGSPSASRPLRSEGAAIAAEPAEPSVLRPAPSPLPLSRSGEGFAPSPPRLSRAHAAKAECDPGPSARLRRKAAPNSFRRGLRTREGEGCGLCG